MKLTISKKLLLSYLFMAILTVLASAYAVYSLQKLNSVAFDITHRNFALVENGKNMMDALLAQESAEKKYIIFKDPSLEQIFWKRNLEFKTGLEAMKKLHITDQAQKSLEKMALAHDRYGVLFYQEVAFLKEGRMREAFAISDSSSKAAIDEIALQLRDMQKKTEKAITDKMMIITTQTASAINMTLGLTVLSLILGISLALLITGNISQPLKKLQKATTSIAEGNLDHKIKIDRQDEIGALAKDFAYMTQRLKILEEINLDASPLTGLPGNLAIENHIKNLLADHKLFSLCQVDLDNFKPFADKYGYAWGSEVIKEVAAILRTYVAENPAWTKEMFLGHIGGDDFVVIANPDQARSLCERLVADFADHILPFFDAQDARNGYLQGKDRQGVMRTFPLVTVSVAIVTDDGSRFNNPLDMAMLAAKLKEYAKLLPGSNCMTEEEMEKQKKLKPLNKQSKLEL